MPDLFAPLTPVERVNLKNTLTAAWYVLTGYGDLLHSANDAPEVLAALGVSRNDYIAWGDAAVEARGLLTHLACPPARPVLTVVPA